MSNKIRKSIGCKLFTTENVVEKEINKNNRPLTIS